MRQRNLVIKALALLLALLIAGPTSLNAQGSSPQLPPPGSATGISRQDQEQLGLKAEAEVYKQMPVLPDSSPVTQYVQQLGRRLENVIPKENSWPYQFHVIPQKEINAFALPGGPIFVNLGTIQAADNEAELAGVMAHEMSHVYMQHSAKQASKASLANILVGIAGAVLPGSTAGNLARLGIQIGASGVALSYSRKDEAEADAVGAVIMYKEGYDPKALADFFLKLEKEGGSARGPQFFSDHPNPGNRQAAISKQISGWPAKNYTGTSNAFSRVHKDAEKIQAYNAQEISDGAKKGLWAQQNQAGGVVPTNLPPAASENAGGSPEKTPSSTGEIKTSGKFKQLQEKTFSISYPDNWQTGQGFGGITITPPGGATDSALSYGVVIGEAGMSAGQSLDQAAQAFIKNLVDSNEEMRTDGNATSIKVGKIQGRSVFLLGPSPVEQDGKALQERDWLVILPHAQGSLTYLIFVTPERDYNELHPTYQKMLESFRLQ